MSAKLDSFEKILNLMDNAGTDGEAQAAASAFRRLLLKENMTEEEVRSRLGDRQPDPEVESRTYFSHQPRKWYGQEYTTLLNIVAKNNLTTWLIYEGSFGIIVGRPHNIDRTIEIFEKTKAAADRMLREARSDTLAKVFRQDFGRSYLRGFLAGLHKRYEMEKTYDSANETALVLSFSEENDEYISNQFGKIVHREVKHEKVNSFAFRQGMDAGKNYTDKESIREQ